MKIEWNKVTWYSKAIAVLVFIATFFIGLECGLLYQQAKDLSSVSLNVAGQSASILNTTSTGKTSINTTTNTTSSTTTNYNGTPTCKSNSDCPAGSSCMQTGPIVAGQQNPMVCVPSGQAVPL